MVGKMIILLFTSFCCLTLAAAQGKAKGEDIFQNSTESCEQIFNETASLVEPILLVGSKSFPITIPEIDAHCKLGNDVYKRARKYGKCLQGLARQTLQIYLHGLRRFIRSICQSTAKKQDAINDLKCATDGTLEGWNMCLDGTNRQLDFVSDNSTSVGVVGDVCCIYSSLLNCIDQRTGTKSDCTPKGNTTKFFKTSIALVLKEVIELICSRYATEQECAANNPDGLVRIKLAAETNRTVDGAYLLSPLLKIVNKLSDDSDV